MITLATPIGALGRVGVSAAKALARLDVKTVRDLLLYFPFRYDDYRQIVSIRAAQTGQRVTIQATVAHLNTRRSFKRRLTVTEALAGDETGSIRLVWFNQPFITRTIQAGDELYLSGTIERDALGHKLVSPAYEKVRTGTAPTHTGRLVPIYPLTKGVSEKQIRFLLSQVIELAESLSDWLPDSILEEHDLLPLSAVVRSMHYPEDEIDHAAAVRRLKFDELLLLQLKAELARRERAGFTAPKIGFRSIEINQAVAALPFSLTKSQRQATWEVMQDMERSLPMNRLLSGDVGSGKTVVAGLALLASKLSGYQGALMAPTEILAHQHFETLKKLFGNKLRLALLTNEYADFDGVAQSATHARQRKSLLAELRDGNIDVLVGTQALLVDDVMFSNLGLVVVDEQHRFGVTQRLLIKQKTRQGGKMTAAHFLSMTATPIPRSLALTLFGELDVSIIPELPPGRKPIISRLVPPAKRQVAYDFVRKQIAAGRQMFVVCPLIEDETGTSEKKTVLAEYEKLSKKIFLEFSVAYLHGKMKAIDKEKIMDDFKNKKTDILVSTSVIEVGVDVSNATVMLIEGADRFGLAQLHQFRGRVGRGSHQSLCIVFTDSDSEKTIERLTFFVSHSNGFKLAEKDLAMRGPGDVYGREQSGLGSLRYARLTDNDLFNAARASANHLVANIKKYPAVEGRIREFENKVHLE